MRHRVFWFLLLSSFLILPACAHVISKDLRVAADPHLSFRQIGHDPNAYRGRTVIWGGEIIDTINQGDGSTLVEVLERPLGWRGEPDRSSPSEGRFLIQDEKYLDPYIYRKGREITVAGEILGERKRPVGQTDYRYPLISNKQLYLWPVYYYAPYPHSYYGPWGYPYPGYPWWGYPYGGWGFGFHYHFR